MLRTICLGVLLVSGCCFGSCAYLNVLQYDVSFQIMEFVPKLEAEVLLLEDHEIGWPTCW